MINKPEKKIAAFLSRPPDYALRPEDASKRSWELIRQVLERPTDIDMDEIREISSIAAGFGSLPIPDREGRFAQNALVIHPFSSEHFEFPSGSDYSTESTFQLLQDVVDGFKNHAGSSAERLFLSLWRQFPEKLHQMDTSSLKPYWEIMPADPVIPAASIWEQASTASALASAWPNPSILLFNIASAQDFITPARRTQDAWMGSYLLSYLSWQAIKAVAEECGPDAILFPSLRGLPLADIWLRNENGLDIPTPLEESIRVGNIPNMFTAIVPLDQAAGLAGKAKAAVNKTWHQLASTVKEKIEFTIGSMTGRSLHPNTGSWVDIWTRQNNAFIDSLGVYWSVCPWGSKEPNHKEVIRAAEAARGAGIDEWLDDLENMLKSIEDQSQKIHVGMVYHILSRFAGQGLSARKNIRDFKNIKEPNYKCSLCGYREALYPASENEKNNRIPRKAVRKFWEELSDLGRVREGLKFKGRIRKGEQLCSVCLTKRFSFEAYFKSKLQLGEHHLFPSTAGMGTYAYKMQILEKAKTDSQLQEALENYTTAMTRMLQKEDLPWPAAIPYWAPDEWTEIEKAFFKIDGAWLFEEELTEQKFKRLYNKLPEDDKQSGGDLKNLEKRRKTLLDTGGLGLPPSYYAVLAMDGDHMGEWLTGERAPWLKWLVHPDVQYDDRMFPWRFGRPLGPADQAGLSDSLKNFALYRAQAIVESKEFMGKLIYAGGDDLLAFAPLDSLLKLMKVLALGFRGEKSGFTHTSGRYRRLMGGRTYHEESGGEPQDGVTVSLGVVVAHHTHPLYHVLEQVQDVLKKQAKQALGRNAFAIRVIRRSGQMMDTGFSFTSELSDRYGDVLDRMDDVYRLFLDNKLSSRLPYRMQEQQWAFLRGDHDGLVTAREFELNRLARRHAKKEKCKKEVAQKVKALYQAVTGEGKGPLSVDAWQTTTDLLLFLRFLTGKGGR